MNDQITTLIIVMLTYVGVAIGFLPRFRADRTTIALIGVGVLLVFKQVTLADIPGFLDIDTLVLLFSMMIINSNLRLAGFFKLTGVYLLRLTRKPRVFLLIEIIVVGVLSALFLNDTICIMFTPFLLELLIAIDRNPIPYLIALATSANIGSVATLTGNPQNMIIGSASGISYTQFAAALTPIALLCLGVVWIVIVLFYKHEFARDNFFAIPPTESIHYYKPLLLKSSVVVVAMLVAFLVGVPVALASFIAACVLMLTRRIKPEKIFAGVDWGILAFFAALFILTGSLEKNGVTTMLLSQVNISGKETATNLSLITVVLSNLVSNVPAVLLLKPLVQSMGNATAGWLTLAASSTLAGNLTLLGSVANLIVAESAKQRKVELSFWEYTKTGMIITLITLAISILWLSIFIWK
jgi:Na+/H+ antiporter NhaD/arsenite permease-like protein